jgi:hypothetical protein
MVEMTIIFDRPTRSKKGHVHFQLHEQLPWLIQKYLCWSPWGHLEEPDFLDFSSPEQDTLGVDHGQIGPNSVGSAGTASVEIV